MATPLEESILARLTALRSEPGDESSAAAENSARRSESAGATQRIEAILERLNAPDSAQGGAAAPRQSAQASDRGSASRAASDSPFVPREPASFRKAGLADSEVEALILKFLLARGDATGREIADQVKLPFVPVDQLLRQMKVDQLLVHRGSAPMNDYQYQMSDLGRERARRYAQHCTYFGSAPVSLADYVASVEAQSLTIQHPTADDLCRAFGDLVLSKEMLDRLGPAVNSGRGLFLYGAPGNGKTSLAERVTAAFGKYIWIPRAIGVDGEIIRVFDPMNHVEVPLESGSGILEQRNIDKRWVRIRRPTIIAAGELTMSALEVTINTSTGISEAPLQVKSNCGTLVIDDFGRQRMRIEELLNRWIVPLEKHCDYLGLPNGKKIQVPFDQLIVFSTNLEPKDLVDEAFLRRIPYKIEVHDPSEDEFRRLFTILAQKMGIAYRQEPVDHLIDKHYKQSGRPFRFCHPRDLLMQISNFCAYRNEPPSLSNEAFDRACENYFAIMAD